MFFSNAYCPSKYDYGIYIIEYCGQKIKLTQPLARCECSTEKIQWCSATRASFCMDLTERCGAETVISFRGFRAQQPIRAAQETPPAPIEFFKVTT